MNRSFDGGQPAGATTDVTIRAAGDEEAPALSDLAFRSKSHWGYSEQFMEACREELTVSREDITCPGCHYRVAERQQRILGYYALEPLPEQGYELEALFVEPDYIGRGIGRILIEHAKSLAASHGAGFLLIQGDPNATEFYLAAGGVQVGERESHSIPGRFLPEFRVTLLRDAPPPLTT